MDQAAIPLTWPVISGLAAVAVIVLTNVVILTRRYDSWNKAEDNDKDINGDPKNADPKKRAGILDRMEEFEAILYLWVGKQRADMKGRGIPTDVSDLHQLELLIKEKHRKKKRRSVPEIPYYRGGLPPLPAPAVRTPHHQLPYDPTQRGDEHDEEDDEDEEG